MKWERRLNFTARGSEAPRKHGRPQLTKKTLKQLRSGRSLRRRAGLRDQAGADRGKLQPTSGPVGIPVWPARGQSWMKAWRKKTKALFVQTEGWVAWFLWHQLELWVWLHRVLWIMFSDSSLCSSASSLFILHPAAAASASQTKEQKHISGLVSMHAVCTFTLKPQRGGEDRLFVAKQDESNVNTFLHV